MAITSGTGTASAVLYDAATYDIQVTIGSGSDAVLFVGVASNKHVTSASWNWDGDSGEDMTLLFSQVDDAGTTMGAALLLDNPTTGTHTLHLVFAAVNSAGRAWIQPWYGVGSWRTPTSAKGTGITASSGTTGEAGDTVLDVVSRYWDTDNSLTADGSQTVQYGPDQPGIGATFWGTSSKSVSGATTMQWTNGASAYWAHGAVALVPAATGQFARPAADRADGTWTNEASSNVNLYASIDEETANDADYIRSAAAPTNDTCTVDLSPISTPVAGTVTMRIRARFL